MAVVLSSSVGGDLGEMPDGGAIWWLGLPVAWGATPGAGGGPSTEAGAGESTGSSPAKTSLNKPFILSEVLPPVPYKLATRILTKASSWTWLSSSAITWRLRYELAQTPQASAANPTKQRREISDLLSWVQCFGTYMAVVTRKFPQRMKELLA